MSHQVKVLFLISVLFAVFSFLGLRAENPSAQEILERARWTQAMQEKLFYGRLRDDKNKIHFRLTMNGGEFRYEFEEPKQTVLIRMRDDDAVIEKVGAEKKAVILNEPIRGTDISYEDISLRFLYWPDASVIGEGNVKTVGCWELKLNPVSRTSQYGSVHVWIGKKDGALMRVHAYDAQGKLIKKFEIISVQKSDTGDGYILKQMRIQRVNPESGRSYAPTYLDVREKPDDF